MKWIFVLLVLLVFLPQNADAVCTTGISMEVEEDLFVNKGVNLTRAEYFLTIENKDVGDTCSISKTYDIRVTNCPSKWNCEFVTKKQTKIFNLKTSLSTNQGSSDVAKLFIKPDINATDGLYKIDVRANTSTDETQLKIYYWIRGRDSCANNFHLSTNPDIQKGNPGDEIEYTLTVINANLNFLPAENGTYLADTCPDIRDFNISLNNCPEKWECSLDSNNEKISVGKSANITLKLKSAENSSKNIYRINVIVESDNKTVSITPAYNLQSVKKTIDYTGTLAKGEICEEHNQCSSEKCVSGRCVKLTPWERFVRWISSL